MNLKIIMVIATAGILTAQPQRAESQVKSISELKIVKTLLSEAESAKYRSGRKSPTGSYRIEREQSGRSFSYSVVDNKSGVKRTPTIPGKVREISWPESEDRIAFDVSMIPVGDGNHTGAVGVYNFNDKSTKIFKPDKYLLMNSKISPDGKMIVCTGSGYEKGYIITIDIESGILTELTDIVSASPTWVPNSNKVMFVQSLEEGYVKLILADLETGESFEIIKTRYYPTFAISPDGKSVLFSSPRDRRRILYIIGIDGTDLRELTSIHNSGLYRLRWSPNGRYFSYERPVIRGHHERTVASEIYLYDLITNTERQLTNNPGAIHHVIKWGIDNRIVIRSKVNDAEIHESYKIEQ